MSGRVRSVRVAEAVADDLRKRILFGDLVDGAELPKEDELREVYGVGKPSFREALRILETEGLLSVRRGNVGGAVVHRPTATAVGNSLSMVLASHGTAMADVARALHEVEPACAALCAERSDRRRNVVPRLREIQRESLRSVDDLVLATSLSRRFHEAIVDLCGNRTLIVMAGALEALWSRHQWTWAGMKKDPESIPLDERREAFEVHQRIIDLIAAGDVSAVREVASQHLDRALAYAGETAETVLVEPVTLLGSTSSV